jgi:hypothetical protein
VVWLVLVSRSSYSLFGIALKIEFLSIELKKKKKTQNWNFLEQESHFLPNGSGPIFA